VDELVVCEQVNRLLKALQRDPNETDSDHSGDGSNTDSGRGPSEEGESARSRLMAAATRGQRRYHCLGTVRQIQRQAARKDAAYFYRRSSVVSTYVCMSVRL